MENRFAWSARKEAIHFLQDRLNAIEADELTKPKPLEVITGILCRFRIKFKVFNLIFLFHMPTLQRTITCNIIFRLFGYSLFHML